MNYYTQVLSKYAEFNGRARRSEYWYFVLINIIIISIVIYLVDAGIGSFGALGIIYSLGILIPGLAVGLRRLHDTGRSRWYLLLVLIPLIGAVSLIVFMVQDSIEGQNEYGVCPK